MVFQGRFFHLWPRCPVVPQWCIVLAELGIQGFEVLDQVRNCSTVSVGPFFLNLKGDDTVLQASNQGSNHAHLLAEVGSECFGHLYSKSLRPVRTANWIQCAFKANCSNQFQSGSIQFDRIRTGFSLYAPM